MSPRQVNMMLGLVALMVFPPLLNRYSPDLLNDSRSLIIGTAFVVAIAAVSLNVLLGYAGQISLGHAALLGVGAFASAIVTTRGLQLPMPVGIAVAGVVAGAFAFVLGLPALRLRGLYLAVVTIAFGLTLEQSLLRWKPVTRGSAGLAVSRPLFGEVELLRNADYLVVVILLFFLIVLVDRNIVRTKLGRAFHAIREDESTAQSFGIDVARYKLTAFVISGVIAGFGGALLGHLVGYVTAETLHFTYRFSLALVVIVVVGGLGSRTGTIIAAFFFTIFPQLFEIDALRGFKGYDQVLAAALLVYTMARHPGGFAGALKEAADKRALKSMKEAPVDDQAAMPKLPALPRPSGLPARADLPSGVPLMEVQDIAVSFGGLRAVDYASLSVPTGKIVGLIGPNGAGKTTFFNAVSGFARQDAGKVLFAGGEIQDLPPHERAALGIGRTFQLIGLAKNLPVLENFLLAQHSIADYGLGASLGYLGAAARVEKELHERSLQAIEALGFERFTNTPVRNLSHGQQRLVELACALVTAPELLLLDEPSAGMAPGAVENLALRLKDIRDELGRTVLLIEHNIPLVMDVCDYIYVLNFGQILAHGPAEEIAAHPEVIAAYFGEAEPAEAEAAKA